MRRIFLISALAMIVAACGGENSESPTGSSDSATAPDFSLMLGDGSTFTLSEEARPVFMVFWAEW